MILEQQKQSQVLTDGQQSQESIGMSLDLDSAQVLMQMLSKNLYSDAIGSTIRECASNALDSHRRAGVNEPIIVSFGINKSDTFEFSVEDFGIGLDDNDVKNIISKYGKSTKRDSATELGMMGLGFKAPLAYTSSFYFICRKNGVERKYMMYEGEDVNTIDLLHETPTEKRNGVKVIVPVNFYDKNSFKIKIREQLAYFENVYFNCDEIDNSFQIVRHDHFQWSPMCSDNRLHVCLDDVYYPLDFNKIGIKSIDVPIALRFGLSDGIFPTPNRESIRYTQEAKAAILKRLKDVANYFVEKYNSTIQNSDNPLAVLSYYKSNRKSINMFSKNLDIDTLIEHATIPIASPTMKNFPNLNMKDLADKEHYMFGEYEIVGDVSNGRFHSKVYTSVTIGTFARNHDGWWRYRHPVILNGNLTSKLKDYLRERGRAHFNLTTGQGIFVIKNRNKMRLGWRDKNNYATYYRILNLKNFPKSQWRTVIKEFQEMMAIIDSALEHIDDSIVTQEFIDSRKKKKNPFVNTASSRRAPKLKGEVIGKIGVPKERGYDGCKFVPITIQMENAHKDKLFTVYGNHTQANKMSSLYDILDKKTTRILTFSEREMKTLEKIKLHNWISMEDFMKGEHKVFRRAVTAALIEKLRKTYKSTFSHIPLMKGISIELGEKLERITNYSSKYCFGIEDSLLEDMFKISEEKNLFDYSIYGEYKEVKEILETCTFIDKLCARISYYDSGKGLEDIFVDLFKYHRKRLNIKHYKMFSLNVENPTPVDVEELEEAI